MILLHKIYGWLLIAGSVALIGSLVIMSFFSSQALYGWIIFFILSAILFLIGRIYIKFGTKSNNNIFTNISVILGLISSIVIIAVFGISGFYEEVFKITLFKENAFVAFILPIICVMSIATSLIFLVGGWISSRKATRY